MVAEREPDESSNPTRAHLMDDETTHDKVLSHFNLTLT